MRLYENKYQLLKFKFENQKMSTLAMDFLKKEFCNLPLSNMNESGDYIFNCDYYSRSKNIIKCRNFTISHNYLTNPNKKG